ncbi:MAG: hypothetical protein WC800_03815 [Candidatus Nanopelagicaceae bacterium]|jgi:hypothetical protein
MKNMRRSHLLSSGRTSALFLVPLMVALSLVLSSMSPFVASSSAADSAKTCMADRSLDSVNVGKYFAAFLTQAKKDWRKDANISSVRMDDRSGKNFDALCTLNIYSSWMIVLYSVSSKTEQVVYMDSQNKTDAGIPRLLYSVKKVASSGTTFTNMTIADIKKEGGWVFDVYSRPETAAQEKKGPANLFLTWKMTLSDVVQKFLDRTRNEAITAYGWSIYIGKRSLKTSSPYANIYWQNGSKKQAYYVEPITLKSYLVKY